MIPPLFTRDLYEKARNHYGIKDNVVINGQEFAQIPTSPAGLLYWFYDQCNTPTFDDSGKHIGWIEADDDRIKKLAAIVEQIAAQNGYSIAGLMPLLGCKKEGRT